MGNLGTRKIQQVGNKILVEFMTAQQKMIKDHQLNKIQLEEELHAKELDVEIIDDYKKYYKVNFQRIIYQESDEVSYNDIINRIKKPQVESKDFRDAGLFFEVNVDSFQIYFNNREVTKSEQSYLFSQNEFQTLSIEIVYKQKHWAQRLYKKVKQVGQNLKKHVQVLLRIAPYVKPAVTIFQRFLPALIPYLGGLKQVGFNQGINQQFQPLLPLAIMIGTFLGPSTIFKSILLIICPFLSPILWLFGI